MSPTAILREYRLGTVKAVTSLPQGQCNENWRVVTDTGTYILRKVFEERSEHDIRFELAALDYLRRKRFAYSIPSPLSTRKGKLFVKKGKAIYWVYRYIDGATGMRFDSRAIGAMAKCMAALHKATRNYTTRLRRDWPSPFAVDGYLADLESYRAIARTSRKPEDQFLSKHYDAIKEHLLFIKEHPAKKHYDRLRKQLIHCDFSVENILSKGKTVIGLIDFDNCRFDARIRDVAILLLECKRFDRKEMLDLRKAKSVIRNYNRHALSPLTKEELSLLPLLLASEALDACLWRYYLLKHQKRNTSYTRMKQYYGLATYLLQHSERIVKELSY